jgi:hypothetical protein
MRSEALRRASWFVWSAALALVVTANDAGSQQRGQPPVQPDAAGAAENDASPRNVDPDVQSILNALKGLQGYVPTEYAADSATYMATERTLRLHGSAEVSRNGERLTADSIIYRDQTQLVEAYGSPRVTGQSIPELRGDQLFYDFNRGRASAIGARTTIVQNATWYVTGHTVSAVGTSHIYARHADFTSCDLEGPHYHFSADRIKIIQGNILVAAPARLYFGDVPVLILPFVIQSLEEGRRSGLLAPRLTLTDVVRGSSGYTRQISDLGWYWAINEYLGGQMTGTWRSGAYVALNGNLGFNWRRQFLGGNFGFSRYWQNDGNRQFGVNSTANWRPDERSTLAISANYMSSTQFVRQTTIDPREATQDLVSTLNARRTFNWGTVQLGSDLRKSIADGGISANAPSFTISPNTITLFRELDENRAGPFNNITLGWGLTGARSFTRDRANFAQRLQDGSQTRLQGGINQLSMGNLNLSATGQLNQRAMQELIGRHPATDSVIGMLPRMNEDIASWSASVGYQQRLIAQTFITPNFGFNQELRRDSLTGGEWLAAPQRMAFGASTNTTLFGFFPGFGPFSSLRHRLTPGFSYAYSPEVVLNDRQREVFGASGGYTQNRVVLSLNQTWEAKLREVRQDPAPRDTLATPGDTLVTPPSQVSVPSEPQKVTLLSINTSPVEYDFTRAARDGNGFVTQFVSNNISSDYLRGLSVQMQHELFDRTRINPNDPGQRGQMGRFAPRLSSLSTGFDLGPSSTIVQWLQRLADIRATLDGRRGQTTDGIIPGSPPESDVTPPGSTAFTNNPQAFGGGVWTASLRYAYSRSPRIYLPPGLDYDDRGIQTLDGQFSFPLTPGWGVSWNTSYSLTDREFGSHALNFRRDLHEWQANFSFYKTPTGNSAFQFYVELLHAPEIRFDHREDNLGIDRRR